MKSLGDTGYLSILKPKTGRGGGGGGGIKWRRIMVGDSEWVSVQP